MAPVFDYIAPAMLQSIYVAIDFHQVCTAGWKLAGRV